MEHFELPAPNNCSQNVIVIVAVGNSCIWSVKQSWNESFPHSTWTKRWNKFRLDQFECEGSALIRTGSSTVCCIYKGLIWRFWSASVVSCCVWKELAFGLQDTSDWLPRRKSFCISPQDVRQFGFRDWMLSVEGRLQGVGQLISLPILPHVSTMYRSLLKGARSATHILQGSRSEIEGGSNKEAASAKTLVLFRTQSSAPWRQGSLTRLHLALMQTPTQLPLGAAPTAALRAKDKAKTRPKETKKVVNQKSPLQINSPTLSRTCGGKKAKWWLNAKSSLGS